jgi:hypothetical protein
LASPIAAGANAGSKVKARWKLATADKEVTQRQNEHNDDGAINPTARLPANGLPVRDFPSRLQALRSNLVDPREYRHSRESERHQDDLCQTSVAPKLVIFLYRMLPHRSGLQPGSFQTQLSGLFSPRDRR